jgi:hypothetical protein
MELAEAPIRSTLLTSPDPALAEEAPCRDIGNLLQSASRRRRITERWHEFAANHHW